VDDVTSQHDHEVDARLRRYAEHWREAHVVPGLSLRGDERAGAARLDVDVAATPIRPAPVRRRRVIVGLVAASVVSVGAVAVIVAVARPEHRPAVPPPAIATPTIPTGVSPLLRCVPIRVTAGGRTVAIRGDQTVPVLQAKVGDRVVAAVSEGCNDRTSGSAHGRAGNLKKTAKDRWTVQRPGTTTLRFTGAQCDLIAPKPPAGCRGGITVVGEINIIATN
jgi:hypothetical protein